MATQNLEDFFVYIFPKFTAIAVGATQIQSVTIQADSDFLMEYMCYTADIAGASQTDSTRLLPNCTVLLTDTGSGRQLMNSGVPIQSIFGTGQDVFKLPKPKRFSARSTIQAQVTSFEAAVTPSLFLSLVGRKIFSLG